MLGVGGGTLRSWLPTGTGAEEASQTFLVSRFPGRIDEAPPFADQVTLLTAIYLNFAQIVLETIEAEIGPLDEDEDSLIFGSANLRDWLDKVSAGRTPVKGRLVGLHRFVLSMPGGSFAGPGPLPTPYTLDCQRNFAAQGVSAPLVFGLMNRKKENGTQHHPARFLQGPACVRASCDWNLPAAHTFRITDLAGAKVDLNGGTPIGYVENSLQQYFVWTAIIVVLPVSTQL